ncbi:hypothetical protein [Geothrix sp. PMB-07]|uniref:hypothetical protein n=1 Tax=Geothrix sp. PMB-07 TaxID=3068640 RepID=UPI0027410DDD|nr:hypothetical protein [Geothrix sp. PMB-07]WLT32287.1 hypothetical protein Q9293_02930 [Geothrix sp. PMB-07]
MRKSSAFLSLTGALSVLFVAMLLHANGQENAARRQRQASLELVRRLGLTDLCLFTEARYTRHPAMADRHAAFQDHPMGLDHFPSGSLVTPPPFPSPHAPRPQHP